VLATVKNKNGEVGKVLVRVSGLGPDKQPLWATSQVFRVDGMEQVKMNEALQIPSGTLKGTSHIRLRVVPQK
jgi:hypothetical protein